MKLVCAKTRALELYMRLFNHSNAAALKGTTVGTNYAGVVFGFLALRNFMDNKILGMASYIIFFSTFICYGLICDSANQIVNKTAELHGEIQAASVKIRNPQLKDELKALLRSLLVIRVRVGNFGEVIERESTLVFADFVANQLVGLLLMIP